MRKFRIAVLAVTVAVGLLAGSTTALAASQSFAAQAHVKKAPCATKAYAKKHKAACRKWAKKQALLKAKAKKAKAEAKARAKKEKTAATVFSGKYSGQASTKITGQTAAISANGTGTGSVIGAGKITGTGSADTSQQPCAPFTGTGTITGANATIEFSVPTGANGCGDEGGHNFTLKGTFTVTKATGKLLNAKGSLRFTGVYDRDAGTFSINVRGTLTK